MRLRGNLLNLRRQAGETYELRREVPGTFDDATGILDTTTSTYTGLFGQSIDPTEFEAFDKDGITPGTEIVAIPAAQVESVGLTEIRPKDYLVRGAVIGEVTRVDLLREGAGQVTEYYCHLKQVV